eukprot:TRINITY_DN1714_c0_g1_i3.p1 TRINITY_DN1714_c0_g1~~TRINITY_DN1714_c0_g1_i3.p1  ORF type:complete len:108 (+),score=0.48 TRINITY_DN1714_c0_g1_i3:225-548(+)
MLELPCSRGWDRSTTCKSMPLGAPRFLPWCPANTLSLSVVISSGSVTSSFQLQTATGPGPDLPAHKPARAHAIVPTSLAGWNDGHPSQVGQHVLELRPMMPRFASNL